MILFVGERVHNKELTPARVAKWEEQWRRNPYIAIMSTPAMVYGPTRQRLLGIAGIRPHRTFRIVNLLPPDREIGTWNDELAELSAMHLINGLLTWGDRHPADPLYGVFLLGKRVSETIVDRDIQFGEETDLCGVPAICFPHPSGRSRYLNSEDYRCEAMRWAEKFLRRVSK